MTRVGEVLELWRYPVSSIGGEQVDRLHLTSTGVEGDRMFGLFDTQTGLPAAPEREPRWRPALYLSGRGPASPGMLPEIGFPDGHWLPVDHPGLDARLTDHFGFAVAIGRYADDTIVSDSNLPLRLNRYQPSALHLLTTSSLKYLADLSGLDETDRRRFRPTMLVDSGECGTFLEAGWIGWSLQLGDLHADVIEGAKRCGMTLVSQPGLVEQPEILRTILRHNKRMLGVYCNVTFGGSISVGEAVELEA
ncbi:MAG: MOSC domain-containing protein [Allorhizobium sp.]